MKAIAIPFATLLFAAHLLPVEARQTQALSECVALSAGHQGTRVSGKQFLLKDGDAHYRVQFAGHCDAVARSSKIRIETQGQLNQLCPQETSVRTSNASCSVRSVETIGAEEYERQARRNRR
ncbi:hypothetical protein FZO89_06975 [Luteimonas viscosa]|uniref:Uncharacterized protein n=1 Tax=Luteimonas viscosa TaxID=1132694 RepID=A0A5D4XPX6_9GAMM|nr:hypothetical protein [Luteimonas viscosa]TYT26015.1 hypothetical protein FZO89_06975 [Luteimonas viscosa]